MGNYVVDQTKKGWLTSILELGAWFGTLYSGFLAEIISRKYAILVNVAVRNALTVRIVTEADLWT